MTVAHDAPPLPARTVQDAFAALRELGLRLSTSRRLVLEALFAAEGPVSAEFLARGCDLDVASVHRNFQTLERHGLVRHVHLGHGPGLYALLCRGECEYLYCDRCGAVRALAPTELDFVRSRIRERYGYEPRFDHFAIVGSCAECSAHAGHEQPGGAVHRRESGRAEDGPAGREHGHRRGEDAHSHGDHVHTHPGVHGVNPQERHPHRR